MVFDSVRNESLLFGGVSNLGVLADTWRWDGAAWTQALPAHAPVPNYGFGVAFDKARGVGVLLNYREQGQPLETWEWDGSDWTQRSSVHVPPARSSIRLAYDEKRNVTIMHGGFSCLSTPCTYAKDTWSWDGTDWTDVTASFSPAVSESAMVYDARIERVLLFSGTHEGNVDHHFTNEMFSWDGAEWRGAPSEELRPAGRVGAVFAYDTTHGLAWLLGGWGQRVDCCNDLWAWDGAVWSQRTPSSPLPTRNRAAGTYDPVRQVLVVFGGEDNGGFRSDTWELRADD